MKKLLLYLIFTYSILANDPTMLKGALKEILDQPQKKTKTKIKNPQSNAPKALEEKQSTKDLVSEIKCLNFKAFYATNSINRLLIQLEDKNVLLEAKNEIVLHGETYRLDSCNEHCAHFIHLASQTTITYTYRP